MKKSRYTEEQITPDLPRFSQPVITGDSRFRFGFGDTP
jgi:hypothetical protein